MTAQHRQMLDQVLHAFQIRPDFDLNIMKERQTLAEITSNALVKLDGLFKEIKPDIVLVHGDTTTTFAGKGCCRVTMNKNNIRFDFLKQAVQFYQGV